MNAIGQTIRACRKARGLTQSQLGALCGLTGASIANYEKGFTLPKRRILEKIAAALDMPPDRLNQASSTPRQQPRDSGPPLYDGVLAALRELYGPVEGRVLLGENGASRRYYVVAGAPDPFVLYERDIAAIARSAQASMSPLMARMRRADGR